MAVAVERGDKMPQLARAIVRSIDSSSIPLRIVLVPTSSAARNSVRTELAACQPTSMLPQARLASSTTPINAISRARSGMIRFLVLCSRARCQAGMQFQETFSRNSGSFAIAIRYGVRPYSIQTRMTQGACRASQPGRYGRSDPVGWCGSRADRAADRSAAPSTTTQAPTTQATPASHRTAAGRGDRRVAADRLRHRPQHRAGGNPGAEQQRSQARGNARSVGFTEPAGRRRQPGFRLGQSVSADVLLSRLRRFARCKERRKDWRSTSTAFASISRSATRWIGT